MKKMQPPPFFNYFEAVEPTVFMGIYGGILPLFDNCLAFAGKGVILLKLNSVLPPGGGTVLSEGKIHF